MKIRKDFVTNSSSSSFIISAKNKEIANEIISLIDNSEYGDTSLSAIFYSKHYAEEQYGWREDIINEIKKLGYEEIIMDFDICTHDFETLDKIENMQLANNIKFIERERC